jgi:eukaryotic-like serine/threonine-protein kinase
MSIRPEAVRVLVHGGSSPSAEEVERFFSARVAGYAKLLTLLLSGLYVMGVLLGLVWARPYFWAVHLHPTKLVHLGLIAINAGAWHLTRRATCPRWLVSAVDVALPLSVTAGFCVAGAAAPAISGLFLTPLLFSALVLLGRAALVPSSSGQTLLVGMASALPTVGAAYLFAARDPALAAPATPALIGAGVSFWMLALILATGKISSVIYGLHRAVEQAQKLGPYVLGEKIGEGGMGAVYRAEHALLKRPAAVKLLLPERVGPDSIARFEREVRLTAQLTHPNTVAVYDYGHTPQGLFYYAMEYLEGLTLEDLVRLHGPQPSARVIHILSQAAGALAEAHALGLIHRDIKPANMLFCQRGGVPDVVKLVDFGLVKTVLNDGALGLTQAGSLAGTPLYLSPEAISDVAHLDHRADLYALGAVGYFLLTGHPPFEGKHLVEICSHHLHSIPQSPSQRLGAPLAPALEQLVLDCLAKSPDARPQDAGALQARLHDCARDQSWSSADARDWWQSRAPSA